ncbi:MAG TPA: ABC transporter permease [Myxococcales bacterium]|nr:ABC transporter permease [Myxococcales bacterium]
MDRFFQDVRFGLRSLRKSPGFTAVAVLALALGIGANTALFSVISFALLRPLPYPEPNRLVVIDQTSPTFPHMSCAYPDFLDWRAQTRDVFEQLGAMRRESLNLVTAGEPERVAARMVSSDLLPLLGTRAKLGRLFDDGDDKPGAQRTVVLTHGFWQQKFGGDPAVISKSIELSGDSYAIIGVLPQDFRFLSGADLFVPLSLFADRYTDRGVHPRLFAYGRLRRGVSLEKAQKALDAVELRIGEAHPEVKGNGARVRSFAAQQTEESRPALLLLWGAVALVLLIATANVANLLLARAQARQGEIAVRVALGAGRLRIVQQLLTESVILSLLGGVLGLMLASWGLDLLAPQLASLPRGGDVHLDALALAFTLAVALGTGIGFGLLPALRASNPALHLVLKEVRASSHGRLRSALVVAEVALSMLLLVSAGLLLKSFGRITAVDPGFDARNVLTFSVKLPPGRYPDGARINRFIDELRRRSAELPGVRALAVTAGLPFIGVAEASFAFEGLPKDPRGRPEGDFYGVTPEYLEVMRIPLLAGRFFEEADSQRNVAVIDEAMARRYFPGRNPIGHRFEGSSDGMIPPMEIIGVVGHVQSYGLDGSGPVDVAWYVPEGWGAIHFAQFAVGLQVAVRTQGDPLQLAVPLRKLVTGIDPQQPVFAMQSMEQVLDGSVTDRKLTLLLMSIFSALALLLASVGVYGVMSYAVAQRTRELGIRMALGASSSKVAKLVVGEGARLAAAGVTIGAGGALALSGALRGMLFGVSASDPLTYALIASILAAITLLACWLPALRASRVEPAVALRAE